MTPRDTSRGVAPSARRTPISGVRCTTVYDTMPCTFSQREQQRQARQRGELHHVEAPLGDGLRPMVDAASQDRLREVILDAYREHEAAVAEATA